MEEKTIPFAYVDGNPNELVHVFTNLRFFFFFWDIIARINVGKRLKISL